MNIKYSVHHACSTAEIARANGRSERAWFPGSVHVESAPFLPCRGDLMQIDGCDYEVDQVWHVIKNGAAEVVVRVK